MDLRLILAFTALVGLAGCNDGTGGEGGAAISGLGDAGTWATDACQTLTIAEAEAAAGVKFVAAEVSGQTDYGHTILSTCSYEGSDILGNMTVALHHDKTGDGKIDQRIAAELPADGPLGPSLDVPIGKGKARWVPKAKMFAYYPDDDRAIYVTGPGVNPLGIGPKSQADDVVQERARAVALAAAE